jgi:hypothetical protein
MRCQHPPCLCPAQTNSPYCSPHCASHRTEMSGHCSCGHPACATNESVGP